MIVLGNYNTLTVKRESPFGFFIGDQDVDDLLLPNKYVPEGLKIGDQIEIFCYLDHMERPVATTLKPKVLRDAFAALKVVAVNDIGAFLDWGLEKHLLVPFREQTSRMAVGETHVIHCYLDPKSFRLVGSARLDRFFTSDTSAIKAGQQVALMPYRRTDLGWEVVVDGQYKGLLFHDQVFRQISPGIGLSGFVKNRRPDGKLDVVLEQQGHQRLEPAAAKIESQLLQQGGFLPLNDKSSPEQIQSLLGMSKKLFKSGVGVLYKARRITIKPDGIYLNPSATK
ncbi:MAG: hypothetical protein RLZZ241_171 [Bacteroidota bacterium]|jgi:predicted RNA-binding protein (virulence factor B family)